MSLSTREMKASKAWQDKKCMWCGKYFEVGDNITLLIPESKVKSMYKKLAFNCIIHTEEYKELENKGSEDSIIYELAHHATPRIKNVLSEHQTKQIECFRTVANEFGMRIETVSGAYLRRRQNGTSINVRLNTRTGSIRASRKGNSNIIDQLYKLEFETKFINRLRELMGEMTTTDFTAEAVITEALTKTKQFMGN